ncbi:MAG: DSD1 family PLP-dependent enzyme [bacterium]|nr:DSD1 family PLP-dependent enzyme [bacterium]
MSPNLADLATPALLLDLDKLEANIATMAEKCQRLGVALRPHIKTHKSPRIARMQLESGAQGITVATLFEAERFAEAGFDDITWAFPIPLSRVRQAVELSRKITLRLLVDSAEAIDALEQADAALRVLLKIDCGFHRAGVDPESGQALALAARIASSDRLVFDGILTHSGQAYRATGQDQLARIAEHERQVMATFAKRLGGQGIEVPTISVGSTPAMSAVENLEGVDEARPGNYVFFDGMQAQIGSCRIANCALTVLTSVVSSGHEHAILDAGALALSKDAGHSDLNRPSFGCGFLDYDAGSLDPNLKVFALSQEHGWITGSHPVGKRVRLLPQHSCLTAAQFDEYTVVRGDEVVDHWPILRGRN